MPSSVGVRERSVEGSFDRLPIFPERHTVELAGQVFFITLITQLGFLAVHGAGGGVVDIENHEAKTIILSADTFRAAHRVRAAGAADGRFMIDLLVAYFVNDAAFFHADIGLDMFLVFLHRGEQCHQRIAINRNGLIRWERDDDFRSRTGSEDGSFKYFHSGLGIDKLSVAFDIDRGISFRCLGDHGGDFFAFLFIGIFGFTFAVRLGCGLSRGLGIRLGRGRFFVLCRGKGCRRSRQSQKQCQK